MPPIDCASMSFGFQALCERDLQDRLVRGVALIREDLRLLQGRPGQPQRDRLCPRPQAWKNNGPLIAAVGVVNRIVSCPELPLFILGPEARRRSLRAPNLLPQLS